MIDKDALRVAQVLAIRVHFEVHRRYVGALSPVGIRIFEAVADTLGGADPKTLQARVAVPPQGCAYPQDLLHGAVLGAASTMALPEPTDAEVREATLAMKKWLTSIKELT